MIANVSLSLNIKPKTLSLVAVTRPNNREVEGPVAMLPVHAPNLGPAHTLPMDSPCHPR